MVFGGWDLQFKNVYDAAQHHNVIPQAQLEQIKDKLEAIEPWPAVFSREYAENLRGENVVVVDGMRAEVAHIEKTIEDFKAANGCDRVVMVNLASTERWMELSPCHQTLEAFEKGIDAGDSAISPAMRYFYVANKLGVPYCNFAPSLTNVPALQEQAEKTGNPYAGMDGKTGQTLLKTALASMFKVRNLHVEGLVLGELPRQQRRPRAGRAELQQDQGPLQGRGARLHRRLPGREPPGPHPLLQAPR